MFRNAMRERFETRQVRRTVWRDGLHAFEAMYAPSSTLPEHEHTSPFFTYVLRGEYVEEVDRLPRHCARGAVIFHCPNEAHANVVGRHGTASLNVELTDEAWRELTTDMVPSCEIIGRALSGDVEWMALTAWREFHLDDSASTLGLDEAVAMLCAEVKASHARGIFEPHRRLDRCTDFLRANATSALRLGDVARIAGVHPMYLARLFRKRYGYSMGEFVRRQRIAWACDQLSRDSGTISAVALRAGFADHAHFTRTFRRITGCAPRWYRQHVSATTRQRV
ncbi:MAG: AraC family transcriptional regulator [Gemmatimonadota bacterium]|nr:AraC family transcriptional regulator [Gemmatimonadota bacterium]